MLLTGDEQWQMANEAQDDFLGFFPGVTCGETPFVLPWRKAFNRRGRGGLAEGAEKGF
jgi:hypothetical protein